MINQYLEKLHNNYLNIFHKFDLGARFFWNWSAFFFAEFWFLYRGMFKLAIPWLMINLSIFTFIEHSTNYIFFTIFFFIRCYLGLYANNIYYKYIKSEISTGKHLIQYHNIYIFIPFLIFSINLFGYIIFYKHIIQINAISILINTSIILLDFAILYSIHLFDNRFLNDHLENIKLTNNYENCNHSVENIKKITHGNQKEDLFYYKIVFNRIQNNRFLNLNFAFLFFGYLWMLYKKMYKECIFFFILSISSSIIIRYMPEENIFTCLLIAAYDTFITIMFLSGANLLYYSHEKLYVSDFKVFLKNIIANINIYIVLFMFTVFLVFFTMLKGNVSVSTYEALNLYIQFLDTQAPMPISKNQKEAIVENYKNNKEENIDINKINGANITPNEIEDLKRQWTQQYNVTWPKDYALKFIFKSSNKVQKSYWNVFPTNSNLHYILLNAIDFNANPYIKGIARTALKIIMKKIKRKNSSLILN